MSATMPPLVSCIMPTANRRPFAAKAIDYFLAQDYPHRELVIVDDGTDRIADLVPADPRIRYFECRLASIGAKRNFACQQARGAIVIHWDDDDWMATWRITYQVRALSRTGADACGLATIYRYDVVADKAWISIPPPITRPWVAGCTLCYTKSFWRDHPFTDISHGEDTQFLALGRPRLVRLRDSSFFVAIVHPNNTTARYIWRPNNVECDARPVRRLLGRHRRDYAAAFARRGR